MHPPPRALSLAEKGWLPTRVLVARIDQVPEVTESTAHLHRDRTTSRSDMACPTIFAVAARVTSMRMDAYLAKAHDSLMLTRVSCFLVLMALLGCGIQVPREPQKPDAVGLRGAELVPVDGRVPEDSIGLEVFSCSGEWYGQGRVRHAGTYRIQQQEVCVTYADGRGEVCRAFRFDAPGEVHLRDRDLGWIEYQAFQQRNREGC